MKRRFVLAPGAALDLVKIWRFIGKRTNLEMADRIEGQSETKSDSFRGTLAPDIGDTT